MMFCKIKGLALLLSTHLNANIGRRLRHQREWHRLRVLCVWHDEKGRQASLH